MSKTNQAADGEPQGFLQDVLSVVALSFSVVSAGSVTRNHPHCSNSPPPPSGLHQLISLTHTHARTDTLQDTSQRKTTTTFNSVGAASQRLCYSRSSGLIRVVVPPRACGNVSSRDFQRELSQLPIMQRLRRELETNMRLINTNQSVVPHVAAAKHHLKLLLIYFHTDLFTIHTDSPS